MEEGLASSESRSLEYEKPLGKHDLHVNSWQISSRHSKASEVFDNLILLLLYLLVVISG